MTHLQAVYLGFIQGVTEFLPVSSSGHLALFSALLGIENTDLVFEVFVHFATMLAVVIYFRKSLLRLTRTQIAHIVLASIPAAVVGLLFESHIATIFNSLGFIGLFLIITGLVTLANQHTLQQPPKNYEITARRAFIIGLAQAVAILPGISRSGSTVAAAVFQGINKQRAFEFSFLLSIPVILGATLLKFIEIRETLLVSVDTALITGFVVAFFAGLASLKLFEYIMKQAKLTGFAVYCLVVGFATLLLQLF